MSLLAINQTDLIVPKRIYLINATPVPFTDEEWFDTAKQHQSYDPKKLPPLQMTIPGGHPSQADSKMRRGLMNHPDTPVTVCISIRSGKKINRPSHSWICLSEENVYWHANYNDLGLVHIKPNKDNGRSCGTGSVSRGFSKTITEYLDMPGVPHKRSVKKEVRERRYYLIPVPECLADTLSTEIIRHAFG